MTLRSPDPFREQEPPVPTPRGVSAALVALGGACVVFAVLALSGRTSAAPRLAKSDPLSALVGGDATRPGILRAAKTELSVRDVTFPGILSDARNPTTALAAVKGTANTPSSPVELAPHPPARSGMGNDGMSGSPLPAQQVLQASPVVTRPRDSLTQAATESAQLNSPPIPSTPPGHEGGVQLQISSFRTNGEAQNFSDQLRARGHHAYVVEANVPGRGTWHRVRIGPFATQQAAASYRLQFEAKEHMVAFLVPLVAH